MKDEEEKLAAKNAKTVKTKLASSPTRRLSPDTWPLTIDTRAFAEEAQVAAHDGAQSKRFDGVLSNVVDGFVHGIGRVNELYVVWADGSDAGHLFDKGNHFLPVIGAHNYDGKLLDFAGLDQGKRFE